MSQHSLYLPLSCMLLGDHAVGVQLCLLSLHCAMCLVIRESRLWCLLSQHLKALDMAASILYLTS